MRKVNFYRNHQVRNKTVREWVGKCDTIYKALKILAVLHSNGMPLLECKFPILPSWPAIKDNEVNTFKGDKTSGYYPIHGMVHLYKAEAFRSPRLRSTFVCIPSFIFHISAVESASKATSVFGESVKTLPCHHHNHHHNYHHNHRQSIDRNREMI